MFTFSVCWSDDSDSFIRRSWEDFRRLHVSEPGHPTSPSNLTHERPPTPCPRAHSGFQPRDPCLPSQGKLVGLQRPVMTLLALRKPSRRPSRWRRACCGDLIEFSPSSQVRPAGIQEGGAAAVGREEPGQGSHSCPVLVLPAADAPWLVHRSRTGRGLARLQLLEDYLRALLAAGERVSRSLELTGFFTPQPLDLEPMLPPGRCLPGGRGRRGGEGPTSGLAWRPDGPVGDT